MAYDRAEYSAKYRKKNKDKIREYQKHYVVWRKDELKEYNKEYNKKYYQEHKKVKVSNNEHKVVRVKIKRDPQLISGTRKEYNANKKREFLSMYGEQCACCGDTHIEFLTLEHIGGLRGEKREGSAVAAYIKATKEYRPDLYEVLCMNCNWSKRRGGVCPHEYDG